MPETILPVDRIPPLEAQSRNIWCGVQGTVFNFQCTAYRGIIIISSSTNNIVISHPTKLILFKYYA